MGYYLYVVFFSLPSCYFFGIGRPRTTVHSRISLWSCVKGGFSVVTWSFDIVCPMTIIAHFLVAFLVVWYLEPPPAPPPPNTRAFCFKKIVEPVFCGRLFGSVWKQLFHSPIPTVFFFLSPREFFFSIPTGIFCLGVLASILVVVFLVVFATSYSPPTNIGLL